VNIKSPLYRDLLGYSFKSPILLRSSGRVRDGKDTRYTVKAAYTRDPRAAVTDD